MTVVIADTSPINYPILIGEAEILARLYHRIVMPEEVFAELIDDGAPPEVRQWTKHGGSHLQFEELPRSSHAPEESDSYGAGQGGRRR